MISQLEKMERERDQIISADNFELSDKSPSEKPLLEQCRREELERSHSNRSRVENDTKRTSPAKAESRDPPAEYNSDCPITSSSEDEACGYQAMGSVDDCEEEESGSGEREYKEGKRESGDKGEKETGRVGSLFLSSNSPSPSKPKSRKFFEEFDLGFGGREQNAVKNEIFEEFEKQADLEREKRRRKKERNKRNEKSDLSALQNELKDIKIPAPKWAKDMNDEDFLKLVKSML